MELNLEKNSITIFGKKEKFDSFVNKLAGLSGEQIFGAFAYRGILIPRTMNCYALYSVINNKLKTLYASDLSRDYFQRLKYYKCFSEIQLYNLFLAICKDKSDFKQYRINLIKLIIINNAGLNLLDGELNYLKGLTKLSMEKFPKYFSYISNMCREQENTFDGVDIKLLKNNLELSATNQEIIELSTKYGIKMPSSLKKSSLIQYVLYHLNGDDAENDKLKKLLEGYTIQQINEYCEQNNIVMSSNLNKPELVNYLFYILRKYEILQTSVKRVVVPDEYKPLDIEIDYTLFKGFFRNNSKRVILYPGCENDEFVPKNDCEVIEE